MIDFTENDLLDEIIERNNATFAALLDTPDFLPPFALRLEQKIILRTLKKEFRRGLFGCGFFSRELRKKRELKKRNEKQT